MDKTAFIPKKTLTKPVYKAKGVGLFFGFSLFLLIFSGLVFGGVYFYKKTLESRVDVLSDSLKRAQAGFEPALIAELSRTAEKIDSAKILLKEHKALTPIFEFLEQSTLESVRFYSFDYSFSENKEPTITMEGETKGYSSLALQAEEFQKNKSVESISVSNLSLADKGMIRFNIEIAFSPEFIKYRVK